jgi:hypothetical protein
MLFAPFAPTSGRHPNAASDSFPVKPDIRQLVAQVGDIFADHRPDGRIGDGGQGPLIFLHFRQHFVAQETGTSCMISRANSPTRFSCAPLV